MKYLALLRGINVGGKNKVSMAELRSCFENFGFKNVATYINSGNILFETDVKNTETLVRSCEEIIEKQFGFKVVVMVIAKEDFLDAVAHAPRWWVNEMEGIRNDVLFVIPPTSTKEVLDVLHKKAEQPDKLASRGQVIFWTLPMAEYNKSVVPKIIGTPIYRHITIRSSKTTKKLQQLFDV